MILHSHVSLALKVLPSPLYPRPPGVHEGLTLEHRLGSGILAFCVYVSLPFTGSSSFAASIRHECIHRFLTAVPYNTMQHEAGCQPETATANAATTLAASARQALIVEVPITLPTYTPDQDRMTTKYLAFRAWKTYCLAILNEILDRPFGLFDHGVTAGSVQWNSVGRAIEGRKDHRSLKLSFPTLEYHTLLRGQSRMLFGSAFETCKLPKACWSSW